MHILKTLFLLVFLVGCQDNSLSFAPSFNGGQNPLGPSGASSGTAGEEKITVLAHFCNWHRKTTTFSSWDKATTIPLRSTGLGVGYDSLDQSIIREQNDEMLSAGITPLISWWGRAGSSSAASGDDFLDTYLSVPSTVQFGILYEVVGLLKVDADGLTYNFDDEENAQRFTNDITYLSQRYLSNSKYVNRILRINGKPVVFIWLSNTFTGNFAKVANALKQTVPVYLIGSNFDVTSTTPRNTEVVGGLDAVSAYGIYASALAVRYGGHVNQQYVQMYSDSVGNWSYWLAKNTPQVKLILPLQFTYHDTRGNPLMDQTTPEEAQHFATIVYQSIQNAITNCRNIEPYVLSVSYNEHFEGSSLEPTVAYGRTFIDIVHATFSKQLDVSDSGCSAGHK